ncbi:MAG: DMT family transporter [Candidatus Sumerlaeia bacterium]|nr:DMT family transporter [Candidatus Sumerlaeia bacterium]
MHGIAFALLTVLTTAAWTLLLRHVLESWSVGWAGVLSRIATVASLGAWVLARGGGWRRLRCGRLWGWVLLMSAVSIAINLLLFGSLKYTTATHQALLFRTDLLFALLIGAALGLERIRAGEFLLLPVMLAGMVLVTGNSNLQFQGHWIGDIMAIGAAVFFAANAFIIQHILRRMDAEATALYNHALSTWGFVVLIFIEGNTGEALQALRRLHAVIGVAALGLVAAVSLPFYYAALHRMAVWKVRAWMLATPVATAAGEWLLWGTRLSLVQWLGAAMVLGGLGVLIALESRTPTAPTGGGNSMTEAEQTQSTSPGG